MTFQRCILSGFIAVGVLATLVAACGSKDRRDAASPGTTPTPRIDNPMHLGLTFQPKHATIFTRAETIYVNPTPPYPTGCYKVLGSVTVSGTDEMGVKHTLPAQTDLNYYYCH